MPNEPRPALAAAAADLHICGVNHEVAALALREQLAITTEETPGALHKFHAEYRPRAAALISTCNRTELIWRGDDAYAGPAWLQSMAAQASDLPQALYHYEGEAAVRHLLRVSSGLDSMVLGEPQILGQVKQALALARDANTIDPVLGRLFQQAFTVAKKVRHETSIGVGAVSVAYAAVTLAKSIFADFSKHKALLIGAGDTAELVARHLHDLGLQTLRIVNRDPNRAEKLAREFGAEAGGLTAIPEWLADSDIVISSTASRAPVLTQPVVAAALKRRKRHSVFMIDLAVPRDIAAEVGELRDVFLYAMDDLQQVVSEGQQARAAAAEQAERIINEESGLFIQWLKSLQAVDTIRALRDRGSQIRDAALAKSMRMLETGASAETAMQALATTLTNKLLHEPTARLRDAGSGDERELLIAADQLFQLNQQKTSN